MIRLPQVRRCCVVVYTRRGVLLLRLVLHQGVC
jgi:hypothetical protein